MSDLFKHLPFLPVMDPSEQQKRSAPTLRDYFAAAAMQAILADPGIGMELKQDTDVVARSAYQHADGMLRARATV